MMNCPKCDLDRPLSDQICRRCKYVFDEDRYLDLTMPRSGDGAVARPYQAPQTNIRLDEFLSRPWVAPLASIIPGLGHYLQKRRLAAAVYFSLVAGLLVLSTLTFSWTAGQMVFGLMVSAHATCILDTTPLAKSSQARLRIVAMAAILLGLLFLYCPLLRLLADTFIRAQRRNTDRMFFRPTGSVGLDQGVMMLICFAVSIWVSTWLSRKLSSREQ